MKRIEFFELVEGLYGFFRYQVMPSRKTIDAWHDEIKYIDSAAIMFIKAGMQNSERLPPNIPMAIKSLYSDWKKRNMLQVEIRYNEIEDPRYPIENLQMAYEIYKTRGMSEMMKFCKSTKMPKNDIARVVCTCQRSKKVQRQEARGVVDGLAEMKKIEVS